MFSGSLGLSVGGLAVVTIMFLEAPDMAMLGAHVPGTWSLEIWCVVGAFNLFISVVKFGSSVEETEYVKRENFLQISKYTDTILDGLCGLATIAVIYQVTYPSSCEFHICVKQT